MPEWKRMVPISSFRGSDGEYYPSYLQSWLTWRRQLTTSPGKVAWWDKLLPVIEQRDYWKWTEDMVITAFKELAHDESDSRDCPQCEGKGRIKIASEKATWESWCLCKLVEKVHRYHETIMEWCEPIQSESFSTYDVCDENGSENASLKLAKNAAIDFALEPKRWLILSGTKGMGKTKLLQAIARSFGPGMALFVTCEEIINKIMGFTYANDGKNLGDYLRDLQRVPVLLIDDVGASHIKKDGNGKASYAMSKLLAIVDYRYRNREDYPMAITTNETVGTFRSAEWNLLGDRLADNVHTIVSLEGQSYRQGQRRMKV